MSYNYPMFMHNQVPSQNCVFQSNFRPHTISVRSNANQDLDYSHYIQDSEYKTLPNRYSMYNYEYISDARYQNKHNNRPKATEKYFSSMTPKVSKIFAKNLNFSSMDSEKPSCELKESKSITDECEKDDNKDNSENKSDQAESKKTKVPISFIEFSRNSVSLQQKQSKNKSNLSSLSTESLIKTYSKKNYDNHQFDCNKQNLNLGTIYNKKEENFEEIASKINSLFDKKNVDTKKIDFNYNKFMYYNRLEEQYSSDNSDEKVNNLDSLKNFFRKSTSLYYDSGICGSNSTYVKGSRKYDKSNLDDKTFTESTIVKNDFNESSKNSLANNKISSSSLSSEMSSSSNFSSSFSSSSKHRDRMNAMFKSMNLKTTNRINQKKFRTSMRELSKKVELPIINLNDTKSNGKKSPNENQVQVKSGIDTSRADFTPNLLNRVNLLKNDKPMVRNSKVPPLPQINYNNNVCFGKNVRSVLVQNDDLTLNSSDSINRPSLDRNKKNIKNFSSNLNLNAVNFSNQKEISHRNSFCCNKVPTTNKNNIKIIDQMNGCEKFRIVSKGEKKCLALKDFIGLYSENLNLIKGENYTLLSRNEDDWCYVRDKNGNIGCVPGSYIEIVSEEFESTDFNKTSYLDKDWFHGNISRSEAYTLLVGNQNFGGTYLVRYNSTEKGKFTLCVYKNGKVYNYKINFEDKQYFIDVKYKFKSLVALIEFYQKNQAGLISSLKYPAEKNFIDKKTLLESLETVYRKFEIDRKDIEFHEKIGSGQFGIVLKAEFKKRKIVAVKKMKPGSKEDEMNFNREAEFMMKLQNLQTTQHQNLMQLYGLSKDFDDSILIVTEFVRFGSLYNYLLKNKERVANSKNRFIRLINICIDVCDGMEYLESHNIIHRDLATRNCLVGEGEVIKVADYGLARFTDDCYIAHPQSQFPVKWSAPEVIKYRSYSSKSDVWSFSCLMYEVFTLGKMPYGGSTANSIAAKQIISGIIPEKPIYCPASLYESIITRAWNKNPKDRPSFKELLKLLENFT